MYPPASSCSNRQSRRGAWTPVVCVSQIRIWTLSAPGSPASGAKAGQWAATGPSRANSSRPPTPRIRTALSSTPVPSAARRNPSAKASNHGTAGSAGGSNSGPSPSVGLRSGPAARIDLVDRVEQEEVLHVVVLLESRRLELEPDLGRRPCVVRAGIHGLGDDQRLGGEALEQLLDALADAGPVGLVDREGGHELVGGRAARQQLPDRHGAAGQVVVAAAAEVDRDHLAVDRLVDDVMRVDAE